MWKSFENFDLQTSEKVCWEEKKKKHAQNIRSTVHRTGDLKKMADDNNTCDSTAAGAQIITRCRSNGT